MRSVQPVAGLQTHSTPSCIVEPMPATATLLGNTTPINNGNLSEGLLALKDGKWVVLRVPYPLGFYTKWMDGRIDDAKAGWKGRGLWSTISTRAPFHMETGKGTSSKVFKMQIRPDPLPK